MTTTPPPPCPFCSSRLIERMTGMGEYWTRCRQCGVATAMRPTQAEADALWAMRAKGAADRAVRRIREIMASSAFGYSKLISIYEVLRTMETETETETTKGD